MKRLRLPRNFTLNGLIIFVALFCVSTFAFFEHMSICVPKFSELKLPLMYVGFVCIVTQIRTIMRVVLKKNKFYMLLALAMFCVVLIISMFFNRDTAIGVSPLRDTIRLLLYLVEVFMLMIVIAETGRGQAVLRFLFWYLFLIMLVNDLLMFTGLITFKDGNHEGYLVGTKFSVSYLHMNLLTMWVLSRRGRKDKKRVPVWIAAIAAVLVAMVAIRINCMTGVLGSIVLVVLFAMMEGENRHKLIKLTSPWMLLLVLVLSVVLAFLADTITQIPLVRYLVEDVLKRDTSITGRTNIYEMYVANLTGRWMWGYGYGNGNDVAVSLFGYQNVQNGFLHWVLQVGIAASVCMAALMLVVFRQANRCKPERRDRLMPLVALVYMYIILGTIETTFNMAFIMWFALIFMLANERAKYPVEQKREMRPRT